MTLRLRLILALVGLAAAGLLIADVATYLSQRSFLIQRVDQQLRQAQFPVRMALESGMTSPLPAPAGVPGGGGSPFLPSGTYGQLRDASGRVTQTVSFAYGQTAPAPPDLPTPLPSAAVGDGGEGSAFTVGAAGDAALHYRVLVDSQPTGTTTVVAIPLTETQQTLRRLLVAEALITAAVLGVLAALAWWIVRRDLRPLDHMTTTAGAIAAGDLSRRVEPGGGPRTEVGRLGLALNSMLEQIEAAFAERRASEEKLRRFLADASHELRTPLTSIRGYAEVFDRGAKDDPNDLATAMRRIDEESQRMGSLVDELLLLARLGEGRELERAPVDLARVVGDSVCDARTTAPARAISLAAPETLSVVGDDVRLRQVVANLLTNALRHTPEGSLIDVRLTSDGDWAALEVEDHGPGLTPEQSAKAFEPFYRADASRARGTGGAGLGLAIVEAVVSAHSGRVDVASTPGAGATFTVRLPVGDQQ